MRISDRDCCWCGRHVPEGAGVHHTDLGTLAHQGECTDAVDELGKDRSRSKRGRWRRPAVVRRLLQERRKNPDSVAVALRPGAQGGEGGLEDTDAADAAPGGGNRG